MNAAGVGVLRAALSGPGDALTGRLAELDSALAALQRLVLDGRAAEHGPTSLERWLFAALEAGGMIYEPYAPVGRYVADALLPEYRVIIEADGVRWHRKREARGRERDGDLAAAGYTVMHFTDLEMTSQRKALALIAEAGRRRDRRARRAVHHAERSAMLRRPRPGHQAVRS